MNADKLMLWNCGVGEDSWDCKEIQPVNPKGNQSWIFIGRTDAEAETPILWPHDVKKWLIWEDPDAGKDWRQEKKGMTEDAMVGWHHWLDGHEFEKTLGVGNGQGGLACCSPCNHRVRHEWKTELNWPRAYLHSENPCESEFSLFHSNSGGVFCFVLFCSRADNKGEKLIQISELGIWKGNRAGLHCISTLILWTNFSRSALNGTLRIIMVENIWLPHLLSLSVSSRFLCLSLSFSIDTNIHI